MKIAELKTNKIQSFLEFTNNSGQKVRFGIEGLKLFVEVDGTKTYLTDNSGSVSTPIDSSQIDVSILNTLTLNAPSATPVNAVAASSVLTMADVGVEGDLLVIGDDTYELRTDGTLTDPSYIEVDISGGASKTQTVTALVSAQVASGVSPISFVDNSDDTMTINVDAAGILGNAIAFDDSNLTNGSIIQNAGADFLGGTVAGVNGTVGILNQIAIDASYLYFCIAINTVADTNWRRISLGTAY